MFLSPKSFKLQLHVNMILWDYINRTGLARCLVMVPGLVYNTRLRFYNIFELAKYLPSNRPSQRSETSFNSTIPEILVLRPSLKIKMTMHEPLNSEKWIINRSLGVAVREQLKSIQNDKRLCLNEFLLLLCKKQLTLERRHLFIVANGVIPCPNKCFLLG